MAKERGRFMLTPYMGETADGRRKGLDLAPEYTDRNIAQNSDACTRCCKEALRKEARSKVHCVQVDRLETWTETVL